MNVNVRELSLDCLILVEKKETGYKDALNKMLNKVQYISKQDRAFITKLVNGSVEYRLRLEYVINQFSKTPLNKCKPLIRALLLLSTYQILFLDSVPDSAACNEAVKLAKKRGFSRLSGFVNGVLRNISRGKADISYPGSNTAEYLSVYYSIPTWIIDMWCEQYGFDCASKMAEGAVKEPELYAYVNRSKARIDEAIERITAEGIKVDRVVVDNKFINSEVSTAFSDAVVNDIAARYNEHAIKIDDIDYLSRYKSFKDGLFTIQDLSSMIVNYIAECVIASLDGKEEVKVLDMCSAPGSKALYVALIDPDRIHVTMRDISEYKTDMIRDNADRLSVDNVDIEVNDACKKNPSDVDSKDIVILDAPCSGLGVIRRKKDIKYNMSFEQTKELVDIQKQMLDNAADYVSLGGYLIYSTCTTNKNENSVQIQHFLDGHTNYELLYERQMLIKGEDNSLSDGFYVAVMKRR